MVNLIIGTSFDPRGDRYDQNPTDLVPINKDLVSIVSGDIRGIPSDTPANNVLPKKGWSASRSTIPISGLVHITYFIPFTYFIPYRMVHRTMGTTIQVLPL